MNDSEFFLGLDLIILEFIWKNKQEKMVKEKFKVKVVPNWEEP
jgi:hypothetical protein